MRCGWWLFFFALGCTASTGDDDPDTDTDTDTDTGPVDDRVWPGETWAEGEPGDYGMNAAALDAVRDYAFTDGFNTQAVLVVKDGVLVAEWYADDSNQDSLITTWSAGKSVMSSLFGVGLREGPLVRP